MQVKSFFEDLKVVISKAIKILHRVDVNGWAEKERWELDFILRTLTVIEKNPKLWDEYCHFNIEMIGESLKGGLHSIAQGIIDPVRVNDFFIELIRFAFELRMSMNWAGKEVNSAYFENIFRDLDRKLFYFHNMDHYLSYAIYSMPISILNFYMGKPGFKVFSEFEESREKVQESMVKMQDYLNEKAIEVDTLKQKLESYQTAFNFVGLSQGFQAILTKKNNARNWTFGILCVMLMATLTPVGFSFWKFTQGEELSWQKMLPVIGLEFVLIYFFRVVLAHYNSIQTQIMQLELRQSLCQFIQNYAEYAKEMKANDGVSLEKFENLIFSSILSNPDKVPGTFDGVEGLTALVKELRGGK